MPPIGKHSRLAPICKQEFKKEQDSIKSYWKKGIHILFSLFCGSFSLFFKKNCFGDSRNGITKVDYIFSTGITDIETTIHL